MIPNLQLLTVTSLISFAANWQFGYQITYINTASSTFYSLANDAEFNVTEEYLKTSDWATQWSAVVSSFYPGTFVGFVFVPFLTKTIGIKHSLLASTAPALLGTAIQLLGRFVGQFGETVLVLDLIVGRFLVGIHSGCALCLLPLFIIESSPPASRPFLSCLQQVFQALATLLGLIFGSNDLIPIHNLRFEFLQIVAAVPTALFVCLLLKLPPTPFRVVDTIPKGSTEDDLLDSLEFYYGPDRDVSVADVKAEAFSRWQITSGHSQWDVLKQTENVKGLLIGIAAAVSYAFTADDIIDSYSSNILYEGGLEDLSQAITVGYGILLFVTSVFGAFLVDHFGRKKLLIYGLLGTALFNSLAVVGNLLDYPPLEVVGFALTKSAIGFGAGAPAWFLTSELVSPRITHLCQSISTGALLMASGMSTYVYLPLTAGLGIYSILVLAVLPSVAVAVVLVLLLPETRNKTHEEIRWELLVNTCSGVHEDKDCHAQWRRLSDSSRVFEDRNKNGARRKYGTNEFAVQLF